MSAFSDEVDIVNPEYATPLGIAVSAGLGLLNDSYVVMLNGQPAKLFRSGVLSLQDILLMNGYNYSEMLGKTGKSLNLTVDGKHVVLRGEPAAPAVLQVNGKEATLSSLIHAGDQIRFVPAKDGASASRTLGQLLGSGFTGRALVNNQEAALDTMLQQGDVVLTVAGAPGPLPVQPPVAPPPATPVVEAPPRPAPEPIPVLQETPPRRDRYPVIRPKLLQLRLNGQMLALPPKENGVPYYLMDLLQYSGIDFERLSRPVRLEVNGEEQGFQYQLKEQDSVVIRLL